MVAGHVDLVHQWQSPVNINTSHMITRNINLHLQLDPLHIAQQDSFR